MTQHRNRWDGCQYLSVELGKKKLCAHRKIKNIYIYSFFYVSKKILKIKYPWEKRRCPCGEKGIGAALEAPVPVSTLFTYCH